MTNSFEVYDPWIKHLEERVKIFCYYLALRFQTLFLPLCLISRSNTLPRDWYINCLQSRYFIVVLAILFVQHFSANNTKTTCKILTSVPVKMEIE